jgi:hypothetical protein
MSNDTTTTSAPWMSAPVKVPVWALLAIGAAIAGTGGAAVFGNPTGQHEGDDAIIQRVDSIERRLERIESLLMQMQNQR